jgi:hypothetical protein
MGYIVQLFDAKLNYHAHFHIAQQTLTKLSTVQMQLQKITELLCHSDIVGNNDIIYGLTKHKGAMRSL